MRISDQVALQSVKRWFEKAVLGLNLCPFAARPYQAGALVFELSEAASDEHCLIDLYLNLHRLDCQPGIETIVLIFPNHLGRFNHYNQFLGLAEDLIEQEGWAGIYQIASFHPDYQFEGTEWRHRSNWTNRSPYPLLHLLRESSVSLAVEKYEDIDAVPERNINTLNQLSDQEMCTIFGTESGSRQKSN